MIILEQANIGVSVLFLHRQRFTYYLEIQFYTELQKKPALYWMKQCSSTIITHRFTLLLSPSWNGSNYITHCCPIYQFYRFDPFDFFFFPNLKKWSEWECVLICRLSVSTDRFLANSVIWSFWGPEHMKMNGNNWSIGPF